MRAGEMTQFSLVSYWHLDASVERVWDALIAVDDWPRWWRYVHAVITLEKGDSEGLGSLRRYTWSSRLPYRLSFDMRTTALRRLERVEGVAAGDLKGTGRWTLRALGNASCVRYEWTVSVEKPWMTLLSPLLAPLYEWNHNQVMDEGGRGLARRLGVALLPPVQCSDMFDEDGDRRGK
jgi:hypothetical protein